MASSTRSLWPKEIKPTIQSPWAILHDQAEELTKQTNGLLMGQLKKTEAREGKKEVLFLDIVVPDLSNYRHRILAVAYDKGMYYPAVVDAEVYRPNSLASIQKSLAAQVEDWARLVGNEEKPPNRADSDQELRELIGKILQSPRVISLAQSLIARANDARVEMERGAQTDSASDFDSPSEVSNEETSEPPPANEEHGSDKSEDES